MLYKNRFGYCIGGTHRIITDSTQVVVSQARVNHVRTVDKVIDRFMEVESLGVACTPKCGSCRCEKSPPGGKDLTLKEERELKLIEDGLKFRGSYWESSYPWIRDPGQLPDNRKASVIATEKKLTKSPNIARLYCEEMRDMFNRKASRRLSNNEIECYKGPIHYIMHHAVNIDTKFRIVFDGSRSFHGHTLNEYLASRNE